MFLAIRRDPEGHHEAVLPDVHAVEEQRHKVEVVQRRRLPRPELHRGLRHDPSADAAFARAAAHHAGRQGLQTPRILAGRDAHQHVLDDAPIQRVGVRQGLERWQRDLTPVGADPRPRDSHLAPGQHDFAGHRARAGRGTRGLMRIPRTAQRRAILLQHRVEHAEARADHHLEEFAFVSTRSATSGRARTAGDSTAAIGRAMRDFFMAAPCWRACARGSSPLVYHEQ